MCFINFALNPSNPFNGSFILNRPVLNFIKKLAIEFPKIL